jgi:cell division protein FtsL
VVFLAASQYENINEYIYGTTAKKFKYDIYQENKILKEKKEQRKNSSVKLRTVICMLFIFMLAIVVIYRYTILTEMNYEISAKTSTYEELRNANSRILVDVEKNTDISEIRQIAETELGMQSPDKSQIVYVNVPKNDTSTVLNDYSGKSDPGAGKIFAFVEKVGRFFGILQ